MKTIALFSQQNDDEEAEESDKTTSNDLANNFDGEGFARYLAPYAAALILSIGATVAIFKFVLLDY
jgi:hypothetical protein